MHHELEHLPEKVRTHATKMRDLAHKLEKAPLHEVLHATKQLKLEIEALITLANRAAAARR
jgi:hypothetical protein